MRKWYVPLFLLLLTCFCPFLLELKRSGKILEREKIKTYPIYSLEKIRSEFDWVISREKEWYGPLEKVFLPSSPSPYWEYVERRKKLELAMYRYVAANRYSVEAREVSGRHSAISSISRAVPICHNFQQKFGHGAVYDARPGSGYFLKMPDVPEVASREGEFFCQGYLWSIPVMLLVFVVRLRVRNLLVWPEIPHLTLAAIFWPVALFLYPKDIKREMQVKRAVQLVAQVASAAVGFLGFAPAIAKAQVGPSPSGGAKQSQKKAGERNHTLGYGLEVYPQSSGIDAGLMISPWYSHSHKLWRGFNLSGFGFVEAGERKGQFFTNNSLNLSHNKSFGAMLTIESGGTVDGNFIQIGPRVNLIKIPGFNRSFGKVAKSVVSGPIWRVRGPTHYQEWFVSWVSKEVHLPGGWLGSTEGFMRFRPGPRPAVGEPQLILRHPRIPHTHFLSEFWMIGAHPTIRLGVQFYR